MNLCDEYARQFAYRPWSELLELVPALEGKTVLDFGCGVGDQAAELVERGARVIGIDANEELLAAAESRRIVNADFRLGDLGALEDVPVADGIWCSFAAAYFPEFGSTLARWKRHLAPNGWIVLTEIDDLFGHEPVATRTRALLAAHARNMFAANRYDFCMGRKLKAHLAGAGFTISASCTVVDKELSFDGPADAGVIEAWKFRLDRLKGLQTFCGQEFERVRNDLLAALSHDEHRSSAKVYCCVGQL